MENKVYKLKQIYPGSPKEGTIVIEDEKGYYNEALKIRFNRKSFIENYPNSWELQKEKPIYKILSFINPDSKLIYTLMNKRYYNTSYSDRSLQYCLDFYKINSVQRLSDGEEFSIGDIVSSEFSSNKKILKITFSETTNLKKGFWIHYKGGASHIENLNKKTPLFKTEDGVDIFEGDITYHVFNKLTPEINSGYTNQYKVTGGFKCTNANNCGNNYYKVFSSKENAEEWIKKNKPEFSRNQIISLLDKLHLGDGIINFIINELDKK